MSRIMPQWNQSLVDKYNTSGPRYTSYPTALEFHPQFNPHDFEQAVADSGNTKLSLYVHIPFCHKLCFYCGCNKVITRHQHKADDYLDYLAMEIVNRAPLFSHTTIKQLHLGGGTPTFLTAEQMVRLITLLKSHFRFDDEWEQSIEIDPREITLESMDMLKEQGFNRVSIGVQDFNPEVQKAVNREQDEAFLFALVARAREAGMKSVNIDLIYGLPHQTLDSFQQTLKRAIELDPDRMSVFNYAHLPDRFAAQRKIDESKMPSAPQKVAILRHTIERLSEAGYQYIGMDHFAKPEDELAKLQRDGQLHRNFQGYTTHGDCDMLGLGVSSISQIGNCYAQNQKELKHYYQQVKDQGHALWKGLVLDRDDEIRRDVIKQLICNLNLSFRDVEMRWDIDFSHYFSEDLVRLKPLIKDGLLMRDAMGLRVTGSGQLLIRNICMCFDHYMKQQIRHRQFSRVI